MWNRWQDPTTGRFLSEDPARDGSNWYAYVGNSPLVFTDPTGMWVFDAFFFQIKGGVDSKNGGLDFSIGVSKYFPILQFGAGTTGASIEAGIPFITYGGLSVDWSGGPGTGVHSYIATPVAAVYFDVDRFGLGIATETLLGGTSLQLGPTSYIESHTVVGGFYLGTDAAYAYTFTGGGGIAWGKGTFSIPNNGAPVTHLWGFYAGADYQGGQMEGSPGDPGRTKNLRRWRSPRDHVDAAMMIHDYTYYYNSQNLSRKERDRILTRSISSDRFGYNPFAAAKAWLAYYFFGGK